MTKRVIPGIDEISEHQTEADERLDSIEKASDVLHKAIKKDTLKMFAKMKEDMEQMKKETDEELARVSS